MNLNGIRKKFFSLVFIFSLFTFLLNTAFAIEHIAPQDTQFVNWFQQEDGAFRYSFKNRIIGGSSVSQGTYPWMVSLSSSYGHSCGGSLIAAKWVLTAAHCVVDLGNVNPDLNVSINRATLSSSEGELIAVDEIIIHPNYTTDDNNNDVALLKLRTPSSQTPVTLVTGNEGDFTGSLARVIGWGNRSTTDFDYPDVLHEVAVPVVSNTVCNSAYGNITNAMLCAGVAEGGIDSCQGDSGGPLVVLNNNSWTQIGVVSWGQGCALPDYYGVYARLTELVAWVNATTSNISDPQLPTTVNLTSGQSVTGTVGSTAWDNLKIVSSDSDTQLTVSLKGLSDNADLYVRKSSSPTLYAYDCVSNHTATMDETCTVNISGQAATWYIGVYGKAAENVSYTLTSTLAADTTQTPSTSDASVLTSGQAVSGMVNFDSFINYKIVSSDSDTTLTVNLKNLSDDADLYIKKDGISTTTSYDCSSEEYGISNEFCEVDISGQGAATWYVSVYGYADASISYTLTATLSEQETTIPSLPSADILTSGQAVNGIVSSASWTDYKIISSVSNTKLTVNLKNLSDDADLYIGKEYLPDSTDFECASNNEDTLEESCELDISGQGAITWYVSVYGYAKDRVSYTLISTLSTESPTTTTDLVVTEDKGAAIIATPISIDTTHESVPAASTIVTASNDEISLLDQENTQIAVKSNTLVTLHPKQVVNAQETKTTTLLRGSIDFNIPSATMKYVVVTPLGRLVVNAQASNKRDNTSATFNLSYSQTGIEGSLSIKITAGSIEFYDRNNKKSTLTTGPEQTISGTVRRTYWVLPIDGDYVYGGKENTFSWLAYPNAQGYILEYTFPTPNFAEENPSTPEFTNKLIYFYPQQYTLWQDLVIAPISIPELPGSVIEARIFPIDDLGNVISGSSSTDKGTFTFK